MRVVMFVLCLAVFCVLALEGLPSSDNIWTRIHRQNVRFGDGVRDWFRNIKARVLGGFGKANPDLEDPDQLGQGKFTLIDLDTLKLNPKQDWGFRIGNWYYIHKNANNVVFKPVVWDDDGSGEEEFANFSGQNGGDREAEQTSSPLEPDMVSIPTKTPNNADGKREEDNSIKDPQSAEVLAPNGKR